VIEEENMLTKSAEVLQQWQRCPAQVDWPAPVEQLMVCMYKGELIAWPSGGTECYAIFRVRDASIVEEEELESCDAHALDWQRLPIP
jgi:hypothetical protein